MVYKFHDLVKCVGKKDELQISGYCLVVEFHQRGTATNEASLSNLCAMSTIPYYSRKRK